MASAVVVDSGIMLASVLAEAHSEKARALIGWLIGQGATIVVPTLFLYEVVAVLRKNVYRGLLSPGEALKHRDVLLAQPVQPMIDSGLLRRAYELAEQFNRPTAYDSQYLALAERLGCEFWTADERLFNATNQQLKWMKWVGNFFLPKIET